MGATNFKGESFRGRPFYPHTFVFMLKVSTSRPINFRLQSVKTAVLTCCFFSSIAFSGARSTNAQAKAVVKSSSVSGAITPAQYVVGADDVLTVTVLKHPEFSVTNVIVPQNGLITLPVVGTVRATGKTLAQIDGEVTQGMRVKLRRPEVAITLEKPRPRPLYVLGQVKNPGIYEAKNNWRVTEALAAAGGLSVDTGLAAVIVNRNNRKLLDTPLLPLLKEPTSGGNLVLRSGDTLRFYERKVTVSVAGAVTRPGVYSVPVGSGIVEAVGLAGGSA
ncbi:MAG: polysaccharide export protein, partial [Cytophagaceae bacterium]